MFNEYLDQFQERKINYYSQWTIHKKKQKTDEEWKFNWIGVKWKNYRWKDKYWKWYYKKSQAELTRFESQTMKHL